MSTILETRGKSMEIAVVEAAKALYQHDVLGRWNADWVALPAVDRREYIVRAEVVQTALGRS